MCDILFGFKHQTLTHCWINAGPASQTVAQHLSNHRSISSVCWLHNAIIYDMIDTNKRDDSLYLTSNWLLRGGVVTCASYFVLDFSIASKADLKESKAYEIKIAVFLHKLCKVVNKWSNKKKIGGGGAWQSYISDCEKAKTSETCKMNGKWVISERQHSFSE